ncbi:MAG: hypothetical protein FJ117_10980 [Deltaproteobacteria bacterium]|nr:hypothetical protein [Deltaproteobacteria bacterium]
MPPASSGGNARSFSWSSGNPADASGAFRPGPRALTKVVKPLFQTAKLIPIEVFANLKIGRSNVIPGKRSATRNPDFSGCPGFPLWREWWCLLILQEPLLRTVLDEDDRAKNFFIFILLADFSSGFGFKSRASG